MTRQQQQQRENGENAIALIQVPIGDSGEHVSIDPRDLSRTNVEDILGVLQSELAPLRVWLECAKAYLAEDNEAAFLEIVGSGCSPGEKASVFSIVIIINSSSSFFVVRRRRRRLRFSTSGDPMSTIAFPQPLLTLSFSRSLSLFERQQQRQH